MAGDAIDRWLARIANAGASLQLAKSLLMGFLAAAGVEAMEAWNWFASQDWGIKVVLGVAFGVALGYALLGLLMLANRWFWPQKSRVAPTQDIDTRPLTIDTPIQDEIARIDKRLDTQQGSIDTSRDGLDRKLNETNKCMEKISQSAERGRIAYQVAHAMLVLRDIRDCQRKLRKING